MRATQSFKVQTHLVLDSGKLVLQRINLPALIGEII